MIKKIIFSFMFINLITFGEIHIKIFQPLRFNNVNTRSVSESDSVIGEGILEISTDNLKKDEGKELAFLFPQKGLMTNRKKWVKIDSYYMDLKDKKLIIDRETVQVKFYAKLDRDNFRKPGEDPEIVEGDYIGYVPIIVSQYSKLENRSDS